MPTKIQLRRGMKKDLPILNEGEAAFTTDTAELYVGNGTKNYNMSPTGENIIVNGNFQISLTEEDGAYPSRVLAPGSGLYLFGNFYLQNDLNANGNITVTRSFTNGMITLSCSNARPILEYRERLSRYQSTETTYGVVKSNQGQFFTLSYDAENSTGSNVTVQSGLPADPEDLIIPSTTERVSKIFQLSDYESHYMSILLLKMESDFTGNFMVGNFKLEAGLYCSKYTPNPAIYDLACLNQVYQRFSTYVSSHEQDSNYVYFYVPNQVLFPYADSCMVGLLDITIINEMKEPQTGFLNTAVYHTTNGLIEVSCYKVDHGLTSASAFIQGYIDLRP